MSGAPTRIRLDVISAGLTDIGRRRAHNEDAVLVAPELELYGVCDGVGGHAKGDVASALAVATLESFIGDDHPIPGRFADDEEMWPGEARLLAAVHAANAEVFLEGQSLPEDQTMGTTVVMAHLADGLLHVCHVGDSRCYRYRDGRLAQLTRDHNLRNDALRLNPSLTDEFLERFPKNVVTRAVGHTAEVEPDICSVDPWPGDLYLLCSDGLTGLVEDGQIAEALELLEDDLELACEELVHMANAAGGRDNISVVLVRIEAIEEEQAAEVEPRAVVVMPPCIWCGAKWARDMAFCVACGRPLTDPSDDDDDNELIVANCAECSAELLEDTRFCVECGTPHDIYD